LRLCVTGYGYFDRWDDLGFVQLGGVEEEMTEARGKKQKVRLRILQNPTTTRQGVRLSVACQAQGARLQIFDATGRLIRSFDLGSLRVAHRSLLLTWDGSDDHGQAVSAGTYFAVIQTADGAEAHPIVLIR
jgi:flagellar hook assembly protein FlgD